MGWQESWDFYFENYLSLIWSLVITPFIFTLICLSNISLHIIDWQFLVFVSIQLIHHLIVLFKHRIFFSLFISLLLTLNIFFITFSSPLWGVGIWVKCTFFFLKNFLFNAFSCCNCKALFHHVKVLFSLKFLAFSAVFSVNSAKGW